MLAGSSSGSTPDWFFYLVGFWCAILGILTKVYADYLTFKKGGNMNNPFDEYRTQTAVLNIVSDLLIEFSAWGLLS